MAAYYNEIDPNAAEWLRQLIKMGAIADGDVDERSITDVTPDELKPYTQVHFFAGIGTWSYALRQAGWEDGRPCWTGSCPCQPFSSAGKRKGTDDERDLWWAMFWHIQQCRPETVFGEQVASKDGLAWWDVVQSDLEGEDYAATAFDLCAAGIGAPHIRQRLFWVANAKRPEWRQIASTGNCQQYWSVNQRQETGGFTNGCQDDSNCLVANSTSNRSVGQGQTATLQEGRQSGCERIGQLSVGFEGCTLSDECIAAELEFNGMGNTNCQRRQKQCAEFADAEKQFGIELPSFWSDAIWHPCADGKARPAKSGAFPLVDGTPADLVCGCGASFPNTEATKEARAMRLKGYGNGIVAPLVAEFIKAFLETVK